MPEVPAGKGKNKMKKPNAKTDTKDEIARYAKAQIPACAEICRTLRREIDSVLTNAASRIYYSMPVWFIKDNAVVGYNAKSSYVNLLFWNGQAFNEKELTAAGKFKAAQIQFTKASEIDLKSLRRWLRKAKKDIWDYKGLRAKKC
jgi:uncharacterized protein YdhG (YjbR/CyaY superfamily)